MRPALRASVLVLLILPIFMLAGSAVQIDPPAITQKNIFAFYASFHRITRVPQVVNPTVTMLCTSPPKPDAATISRSLGPHEPTLAHFYLNEPAARRTKKTDAFAPGSVIVKEKVGVDGVLARAVGGMRKREPGYDPDHGDWEYFYAEAKGDLFIGKLANCIQCHRQTRATDYVFARWPTLATP